MTDRREPNPPSLFLAHWIRLLASEYPRGSRALDVACGRGRHALALASAGFAVTGIDIAMDALTTAQAAARSRRLPLSLICADLTQWPLPRERFDVVVVVRYLDRRLFPSVLDALAPGGILLYETFTENQLRYDRGPRSRAHLLAPGELRLCVRGMDVLFDEEVSAPDAVARVAARRKGRTTR